ncbi:MAG: serine hydrolase domain-containing protein [Sphingobium sp.]
MDPDALRALVDGLDRNYLATGRLPHMQLLISREEEVLVHVTRGRARESGAALREDSLFRIASMTKPLTSVAFMMLVERGLVALDDPVSLVLPEFAHLKVGQRNRSKPARPMRMIDLLTHMSGLTYGLQHRTPIDARYRKLGLDEFQQARSSNEFIAALAALPLEFSPGTAWNYSLSTDVLGVIVERLAGMDLQSLFRAWICDPLAMPDTWFELPDDRVERMPDAWRLRGDGTLHVADLGVRSGFRRKGRFLSGGGGLISTTADYHRFTRMLLRGGELDGVRVLQPATVAAMHANQLPGGADIAALAVGDFGEATATVTGFGLGFAMDLATSQYYWGGIFSTFFFVDPIERLIGIFMTQMVPSNIYPVREQLRAGVNRSILRSLAPPV